jgi:hypothetical protein
MKPMIVLMMVPDMTDDDAANDELDAICEHIEDRLGKGVEMRRIMQAMLEVMLAQLEGEGSVEVIH